MPLSNTLTPKVPFFSYLCDLEYGQGHLHMIKMNSLVVSIILPSLKEIAS